MALIISCIDLCLNRLGICGRHPFSELQPLPNRVPRTTGNFPRRTLTSDLYVALRILHMCGFITNYAGSIHKSYENMTTKLFATLERRSKTQEL